MRVGLTRVETRQRPGPFQEGRLTEPALSAARCGLRVGGGFSSSARDVRWLHQ